MLEIDGDKVADAAELAENIGGRSAGDKIVLKIRRGDDEMDKKVTLGTAGE